MLLAKRKRDNPIDDNPNVVGNTSENSARQNQEKIMKVLRDFVLFLFGCLLGKIISFLLHLL